MDIKMHPFDLTYYQVTEHKVNLIYFFLRVLINNLYYLEPNLQAS